MLPTPDELKSALEQSLPGVAVTVENLPAAPPARAERSEAGGGAGQAGGILLVQAKDLITVCRYFKETERFDLDYLANLTAIDYPPDLPAAPNVSQTGAAQAGRMDVVYHLYSMGKKHGPVTLKVQLPRANPVVASVTPIWRGAEFQEREAYDLYGVRFEGHPDLRRILMWDGFEGHPMRKDYVVEDQNVLDG